MSGAPNRILPAGRFRGDEVIDAQRKHLEPAEVERLFATLTRPTRHVERATFWHAYFSAQYYYGCRISEVALILKEDVDKRSQRILLRRLKKRANKDAGGYQEKVYAVPKPLLRLLLAQAAQTPDDNPWLFPSPRTARRAEGAERLSQLRRVGDYAAISRWAAEQRFVHVAAAARIPERLRHSHVLRHTRATLLLAEGAPEEDVRELLGHSSLSVTRRYLGIANALRLRVDTTALLGTGGLFARRNLQQNPRGAVD